MDLGGHEQFARARSGEVPAVPMGQALLATAWAALATARAETVDIHLRSGPVITGCVAVRLDGRIGEASVRRDHWTHAFGVEDVALVRFNPRGGCKTAG